jgi:hypothetical protein
MQGHLVAAFCFGMATGALNRVSYGRAADYLHAPEGPKEWHRIEEGL